MLVSPFAALHAAVFQKGDTLSERESLFHAEGHGLEGIGLRRGAFHAPQAPLLNAQKRWENARGLPPHVPAIAGFYQFDAAHAVQSTANRFLYLLDLTFFSLRLAAPAVVNEAVSLFFRSNTAAAAERKEGYTKSTEEKIKHTVAEE